MQKMDKILKCLFYYVRALVYKSIIIIVNKCALVQNKHILIICQGKFGWDLLKFNLSSKTYRKTDSINGNCPVAIVFKIYIEDHCQTPYT